MANKLELKLVEHKNRLGQVIKPGDEVVIVTTGYSHSVSINKGEYLGKKNEGCSCRVQETRTHYRFKETGEEMTAWYTDAEKRGLLPKRPEYPKYPQRPAGWNYQTPEYKEYQATVSAIQAEYSKAYTVYYEAYNKVKADHYENVRVPHWRYTTLQLNRIFKLDTKAYEISV